MNKKTFIFLSLATLLLSGCVMNNGKEETSNDSSTTIDPEKDNEDTEKPDTDSGDSGKTDSGDGDGSDTSGDDTPTPTPSPDSEVTTYLVLGENGLYKGNKGEDNESLFLENVITYVSKIGTALPTKDDVTSTVSGSTFVCWQSYEGDGKLVTYVNVPAENNKILYASFTGGDGSSSGGDTPSVDPDPVDPSEDIPTTGYGFMFLDGTYVQGTKTNTTDTEGRTQYVIKNQKFLKDQQFQLYDFENKAGWVIDIDPWSFGGTSGTDTKWKSYLEKGSSYYKVLQDFTCAEIYLKFKFNDDQIYFGPAQ